MKKLKYISVAAALAAAVFCSSCVVTPTGSYAPYGTYSVATNGYNTSVAWTNASYDANGFPIFGYSYGRPVYGYTEAGVAIFTIAALTALCFVPRWKPAPWYHGPWHHPHDCRPVAAPPRFPQGHAPGVRPHGGMNAPIHRNPGAVFNKHPKPMGNMNRPGNNLGANRLGMGNMNRPGNNLGANRPGMGNMNRPGNNLGANRPGMGNMNRPGNNLGANRPGMGNMNRPGNNLGANRPGMGNMNRPGNNLGANRPGMGNMNRPGNNVAVSRPSSGSRPVNLGSMTRPGASGVGRPAAAMHRPAAMQRPGRNVGSLGRSAGISRSGSMGNRGGGGPRR